MSDPWPSPAEYQAMMKNPKRAFKDPKFQDCVIEQLPNGLPRPRAGNFAAVYKATLPGGEDWAIRVFTRRSPERRARYNSICQYLDQKKLKSMVGFSYSDEGMRVLVKGQLRDYPLLQMEWVSGQTLQEFARQRCRQMDGTALERSAENWIELVRELNAARIAHGDLQHGNVMVNTAGELKLVDYDCMCVPKLEGEPALEGGLPPYQHHARNGDTKLFAGLDRFSALFILVSLKALAAAPQLWDQFVEPPEGSDRPIRDSLLFDASDFAAPQQSELLRELRRSPDKKVQKWTDDLLGCWKRPKLEDIPPLDDFANDFEALKQLLDAYRYDEAVKLADQQTSTPPKGLIADLKIARERVKSRLELVTAVQQGDEAQMQKLAASNLLANYPLAQPELLIAKDAAKVVPILAELERALKQQQVRQLVQIWDAHASLIQTRVSAARLRGPVDEWRQRNQLCDRVLADLQQPQCDFLRLEHSTTELDRLGGHPELLSKRADVDRMIHRGRAWRSWTQVPKQISAEVDAALVAQWNESLFAGWPTAEAERLRFTEAQERLNVWTRLKQVVPASDQCLTLAEETEITRRAASSPEDYDPRLVPRIKLARRRQQAVKHVQAALQQPREEPLVAAYQTLRGLNARSLLAVDQRERLELAEARMPKLQGLSAVPQDPRLDDPQIAQQRDQQLLEIWDDHLLQGCADAQAWRALWAAARQRRPKLEKLTAALDAGDTATVVDLMECPELRDFPLPQEVRDQIGAAEKDIAASRRLRQVLQQGSPQAMQQAFDVRVIQQHPQQFQPLGPVIRKLVASEILPLSKSGLRSQGVKMRSTPKSTLLTGDARWSWPLPRLTDRCLLLVTPKRVASTDTPESCTVGLRMEVTRRDYEGAGCRTIVAPMSCRDHFVVVWALVDVGFEQWWSEPVVLGRLGAAT